MQTLLNLLAGVSLLVWGTHIVRTGILRLYGGDLRRILRRSVARNRFAAFAAGIGVTGLIQSSTATALIVAAFAGQGLVTDLELVIGVVAGRVGVVVAAVGLDEIAVVGDLGIFLGAEEEHVLEEMREALAVGGVVNLAGLHRERGA